MIEHTVDNQGVQIHYINNGVKDNKTPLLFVPGMLGYAEQFLDEMPLFAEREVIALSLRGRGKSDAPSKGFSFEAQVSDITAVIESAKLSSFIMTAFSTGVAYGLAYAVQHPERLKGIILVDYQARYPKISDDWIQSAADAFPDTNIEAIRAIARESTLIPLWDDLHKLTCPILLIRGGQSNYVSDEHISQYRTALPQIEIVTFEDAGHLVWQPDYERFIKTIKDFITKIEKE